MGKVDDYRQELRSLDSWDKYLLQESRLPGPRSNLELAFAVGLEGSEDLFLRYAALDSETAPTNSPEEFLAVSGVIGLGFLAARGEGGHFTLLREKASDPRWRIREAVALGLQKYGQNSMDELLPRMKEWSQGNLLEQRAVVAALCEPVLLKDLEHAKRILDIMDEITESILGVGERKSEEFRVLRKGLAYGWSVVVAAQPEIGKPRMEVWIGSNDRDIRWIMKQNLKKKRLARMDEPWVEAQLAAMGT